MLQDTLLDPYACCSTLRRDVLESRLELESLLHFFLTKRVNLMLEPLPDLTGTLYYGGTV